MTRKKNDEPSEDASPASTDRRWLLLLVPLLAVVASLALSYLWNEDFWWYLSSGQAILENGGAIPDGEDPFVYTAGDGIGWVYHSWLWTVIVALVDQVAGLGGAVFFHALLAAALTALLYTVARVDRWGLANALIGILFLLTVRHRVCGKAEIASWLLLAVFFWLLDRGGPFTVRTGVALGVLQVLWANLHGGYPLGVFIAVCYCAGGWFQRRYGRGTWGRTDDARYPPPWFPVLLFVLAVADPRMFRERLAPFGFVTGSQTVQPVGDSGSILILEWQSPFALASTHPMWLALFGASVVLGLVSFAGVRRRSLPRLLFVAGMAVLGASAIRHLTGLALAAGLVALCNLAERPPVPPPVAKGKRAKKAAEPAPRKPWLYPAACALVALGLVTSAVALRVARPGFDGSSSSRFFTIKPSLTCPGAAEFILEQGLPGPIFNDYPLGAYLGVRLHPVHRVFIDSRVLDPEVVVDYTRMVESAARWKRAEEKYGFRTAVLGHFSKTLRSPLGSALVQDPAWKLVYVDAQAAVFTKSEVGAVMPLEVSRLRIGEPPRVPYMDPPGYSSIVAGLQRAFLNDFPSNYLIEYLANLGHLGKVRGVFELTSEALERSGDHPLLYRQRCAANIVLQDLSAALRDCERAYELRPTDGQVTGLYCNVLVRAGRRAEARAILDKALRESPNDRSLRELRRRLALGEKDF